MSTTAATVDDAPEGALDLNYGIDDVPRPLPRALGLGLQHVLTMFGATIGVPLLLAGAMGLEVGQTAVLISAVFLAAGVSTLLQVTMGTRLPIVQGMSFAFVGPFLAIIAAKGGEDAMAWIGGAMIVGGLVEAGLGFSGVFGLVRRWITPIVIGPVIAMIGLSLFGAAVFQVQSITADDGTVVASGNWWLAILTITLVFVFSLVLAPKVRFFSLFPILLAVGSAYVVALVLSQVGVIEATSRAHVDFSLAGEVPWFRFGGDQPSLLFPWGAPRFDLGFTIAVMAAYVASAVESFGDYHAVARLSGTDEPTDRQVNRGIGAEGLGCTITAIFGGFASTSYTENIGLIGITKVASRYVVLVAAIILIVLGFVTKVGAFVATIPPPIIGGVYMSLFGLITAVGISNLMKADLTSQRNLMVVGFTIFMGLVVPEYFSTLPADWTLLDTEWLTNVARSIGGSGIAVAAFLGLFLDNVLPGTDAERGLGTATA